MDLPDISYFNVYVFYNLYHLRKSPYLFDKNYLIDFYLIAGFEIVKT